MKKVIIIVTIVLTACITSGCGIKASSGHYEADYVNPDGKLVDTDCDGDYHHWVED